MTFSETRLLSCIHQLVSAQVSRAPESTALRFGQRSLSYGELERLSNQAAWLLRKHGVRPESIVGLCFDRSLEMLVGMLGILKAGGAYLPLDPTYPRDRLEFMLQDSQAQLLLTQTHLRDKLPCPPRGRVLCLDSDWKALDGQLAEPFDSGATSHSLAYVIYTSGSTGHPKGVLLEHAGLVNLVQTQSRALDCGPGSRMLQFARLSFDAAVWEIFMALASGATLCLASQEELMPGPGLARVLAEADITLTLLPPVALSALPQGVERELSSLRTLVVGGEACSTSLVERWAVNGRRFFNAYGPTETTVYCTIGQCRAGTNAERPSIGFALEGAEVHVLDVESLEPVRTGEAGELCVAGVGLARGYLNREELTREKFIALPESLRALSRSQRLYRTGDRARRLEDGSLDFLGRLDNQVKLRGHRIELGEVETVLGRAPGVRQAVVIVREDVPGEPRLVGYVTLQQSETMDIQRLREVLRGKLPDFMVPTSLVALQEFPVTPSGKVNREALPAPSDVPHQEGGAVPYRAASTQVEAALLKIWAEVLSRDESKVGIHDDFFMIGGYSLLAAQMIMKVREKFQINIRQDALLLREFLASPTIAELATVVEALLSGTAARPGEQISPTSESTVDVAAEEMGRRAESVDFAAEAKLDESIRFDLALPAVHTSSPNGVLLTGATGFLGAFLLQELLLKTQAKIYCLVRASGQKAAFDKIYENLEALSLMDDDRVAMAIPYRVVPVVGDLALPRFGLSEKDFRELSDKIDLIYHNGALVNFLYPYSHLKRVNVCGTQEVIRLATIGARLKSVHYVSTLAVLASQGLFDKRVVRETDPLAHVDHLYLGYSESKYVAEQLLFEASGRGLPVSIHRPHDVTGHSKTGAWKTQGFLCSLLKSFVDFGIAPNMNIPNDFMPVDLVCEAIVYLSLHRRAEGQVYHLNNPGYWLLPQVVEQLRALGYRIDLLEYDEWMRKMVELSSDRPNSQIAPFVSLLVSRWSEKQLTLLEMFSEEHIPRFDCNATEEALKGSGIRRPEMSALLDKYFKHFQETGFFKRP
jgi:amino acid adenylation domain-containing protein/thioester reductase-like protein